LIAALPVFQGWTNWRDVLASLAAKEQEVLAGERDLVRSRQNSMQLLLKVENGHTGLQVIVDKERPLIGSLVLQTAGIDEQRGDTEAQARLELCLMHAHSCAAQGCRSCA
jgi:hypothetical protein